MNNLQLMVHQMETHHHAVGLALPELKLAIATLSGDNLVDKINEIGTKYNLM